VFPPWFNRILSTFGPPYLAYARHHPLRRETFGAARSFGKLLADGVAPSSHRLVLDCEQATAQYGVEAEVIEPRVPASSDELFGYPIWLPRLMAEGVARKNERVGIDPLLNSL
jgi:hypothetical protein